MCVLLVVKVTQGAAGHVRLIEKPIAVPQATGNRMAAAGFSNRKLGSVREGM
jgi:hypothetical protein